MVFDIKTQGGPASIECMNPLSDDVIFYDTEFSSLDPYIGEILSVGLVKLGGEELYIELEYDGQYSQWVRNNIVDSLTGPKVARSDAAKLISDFVGDQRPYMVANVNCYDAIYTYKLFGIDEQPFHWMPLDFASMLFSCGINPDDYNTRSKTFFEGLGVDPDKYTQHNALDDARLLRETYLALVKRKPGVLKSMKDSL